MNKGRFFIKVDLMHKKNILCDFSLSVGDTFTIKTGDFPYIAKVKTIDTINYGGALRRAFYIVLEGYESFNIALWIEGMGNIGSHEIFGD